MYNFSDRLAAKLARKDSLALKLSQRPQRQELIERNILHMVRSNYFIEEVGSNMWLIVTCNISKIIIILDLYPNLRYLMKIEGSIAQLLVPN